MRQERKMVCWREDEIFLPDPRPGAYYVSVRNGSNTGLLLGPFQRHEQALANVKRGKALADEADSWAWAYEYGTCRMEKPYHKPSVFGK